MKLIDLSGQRFGHLIVLRRGDNDNRGRIRYLCQCSCGALRTVSAMNLRSGNTKSCGHTRGEKLRLRPYEALYRMLKRGAIHPVHLTYEEFVEFARCGACHYCGAPIVWSVHDLVTNGSAHNLDRKDTTGPYSKDNCVPCCMRCNFGKGRLFTYDEWRQIGVLIKSWSK
jgi:hypothetical protein